LTDSEMLGSSCRSWLEVTLPSSLMLKENDFSYVVRLFVVMALWFSPCSIATYILMFSLNWRPLRRTLKLEREVWKLGYGEMLAVPWRAERAKRRVVNTLTFVGSVNLCL
jgi:hypothetical protein